MTIVPGLLKFLMNVPRAVQIYIYGPSRYFKGPFTGTKVDILAAQAYGLIINPFHVTSPSLNKVISLPRESHHFSLPIIILG